MRLKSNQWPARVLVFSVMQVLLLNNGYAQLKTYTILPNITDPAINTYTNPGDEHYVYLSDSVKPLNKLFLFLPGTLGRGKNPRLIVPYAASLGYHAIALTYSSDIALAQLCKISTDSACFENGRQEIIAGNDLNEVLSVDQPNSLMNRLLKLLVYLKNKYPADNWRQFLNEKEEVDWSKVCVAGQSQGGGHAAFIGYQKKVDRVVMFAAPKDFSDHFHKPANWLYKHNATPINRYFAFVHTDDNANGCTWEEQKEITTVMGLDQFGAWINADERTLHDSHTRLVTSRKPQTFAHGSVINDRAYEKVWQYLLLSPVAK